jgi:hypothetical protein
MTDCPVCQRETPPVKIGGQLYCSVCGTFRGQVMSAGLAVTPKRSTLDLSPRNRTTAVRPVSALAEPAKPLVTPIETTQPQPHGTSATALHARAKPSRTLDLRAPAKPEAGVVKPQGHEVPAAAPLTTTHERHLAHLDDRLRHAKEVARSPHIGKFNGPRLSTPEPVRPTAAVPAAITKVAQPASARELPAQAVTHHEAMVKMAQTLPTAPDSHQPATVTGAQWRPHLSLSPAANRTTATVAAVAIMAGYIWLQNYPKLALQTASNEAGIAASLPGYLPSSYSLQTTKTAPGLVTLNFSSPSASEPLKLEQHRTTWDSSSLLDNYVATNTDDYTTVQGQGLTIYLFNNSQAAWVNHGIWYSIAGASRLSREQILKIAYSL